MLAAPGHDPESIVLYQPDLCLLISADALWANGIGVVFPELTGEPGFDDVERTLHMLASLRVHWVIPGHGAPFSDFECAVERAFNCLRNLVADPAKHARRAAKVLIKFHMLEIQACSLGELDQWLDSTEYSGARELVRLRYFARIVPTAWRRELLAESVANGALAIDGSSLRDI